MDEFINNQNLQPKEESIEENNVVENTNVKVDTENSFTENAPNFTIKNEVENNSEETKNTNSNEENINDISGEEHMHNNFESVFNPVNYSTVSPIKDYKPISKGLKVFSLILVAIIVLTGTGLGGYFIGKNSVSFYNGSKATKVDLASKPKDTDEMTAAQVYEKVNKSIVGITVYNSVGKGGQASGIVFSEDGYIITNDHIYSEISNPKFKIHTFDGKEYDAEYVAGDIVSDLAVLKIKNCKLTPATFGDSDELYMGQRVVAIGRPNDATDVSSITSGIISVVNRRVQNSSSYSSRLIQTDSPINPGSSGGALVNMYGQVVGVTSSKLASVEYEGIGFAIPTTIMKRIVDELISEGKVVTRAKLGITYTTINSVFAEINGYKQTGLLVASVSDDSDLYGKINEGDIIIKINDIDVTDDDVVLDIIEKCSAGDTITVTVITKKKEQKTFKAVLKANVGESSFTTKEIEKDSSNNSSKNGGTFDFPFGE